MLEVRIFMNTGTPDNSQGCEFESKQRKIHYSIIIFIVSVSEWFAHIRDLCNSITS